MTDPSMAERIPASVDITSKPKPMATKHGQSPRRMGRRAAIGLIIGGTAGTVAAVQTGAAQAVLETVSGAVRELLSPKPIEVYVGEIAIPLKDVNIRGQTRVANPSLGDVFLQNVKRYNGKLYRGERFIVVTNGTVVEGETPKGEPGGKWLKIKIDDNNPTGEYYAYMSLSEETEAAIGKLDQSKFQKIKDSSNNGITLINGTTLNSQQVNMTTFR